VQTQTLLKRIGFSFGICAVTEVENTLKIVSQILADLEDDLLLRELIVVTPNRALARRLLDYDGRIVVVLEEQREGKASAVRKIIARATGDILVLASADIVLGRHSISRLIRTLNGNQSLGAVDSNVELVNGDAHLADRVSNLLWELHNSTLQQLDLEGDLGHLAGDLTAFRRVLIRELPDTINDDSYMSQQVRRRGFRVKRVRNATIWIAGPRNPADYVTQRSRVLQGHLQLITIFGTMPTTFEFTLMSKPYRNLRVLKRVMAHFGPSYFPALAAGVLLELVSFVVGVFRQWTHLGQNRWKLVRSTKSV
jgi:cellulose synthase/poly-beta-1,6-N-acetylglucosamine synthase-like glycosyltransferase